MTDLVERFVREHKLANEKEYEELLTRMEEPAAAEYLRTEEIGRAHV